MSREPRDETGTTQSGAVRPVINFRKDCKILVLTRGYICRRRLSHVPFALDYLAHSAELFDAYSTEQVTAMEKDPSLRLKPVAHFMLERMEDQNDPETGIPQPYLEIREVVIAKPFLAWYQYSRCGQHAQKLKEAWYQWDARIYEFFDLDGYRWTKQIIGRAVKVTLAELESFAEQHSQAPYDLANNSCHDTRERILQAIGVASPTPRLLTRVANYLRPPVSTVNLSSRKASTYERRTKFDYV
ncbi:hypothetical protein IFR05_008898 [Cadophora sp. M221]|nr:hypothetical protein IFR05_008898 [Cadophora sp. M221]